MQDKVNFRTTKYVDQVENRPLDPRSDPIQYFIDNTESTCENRKQAPAPAEFKEWPLKRDAFMVDYDFVPKNRVMFQPKKTANHEMNIDFFVSPRMFIRYSRVWVTDVMYSDCFEFQAMTIVKEVGGVWNFEQEELGGGSGSARGKAPGIEFEIKSRCNIIKPFKFEWVMHSQFEKEAKNSCQNQFKPFVQRTF